MNSEGNTASSWHGWERVLSLRRKFVDIWVDARFVGENVLDNYREVLRLQSIYILNERTVELRE